MHCVEFLSKTSLSAFLHPENRFLACNHVTRWPFLRRICVVKPLGSQWRRTLCSCPPTYGCRDVSCKPAMGSSELLGQPVGIRDGQKVGGGWRKRGVGQQVFSPRQGVGHPIFEPLKGVGHNSFWLGRI